MIVRRRLYRDIVRLRRQDVERPRRSIPKGIERNEPRTTQRGCLIADYDGRLDRHIANVDAVERAA